MKGISIDRQAFSRAACFLLVALSLLTWTAHPHAQTAPAPIRYRLTLADKQWALELTIPTLYQPLNGVSTVTQLAIANPSEFFSEGGDTAWLMASQNRYDHHDLPYVTVSVQAATQSFENPAAFRAFALKRLIKDVYNVRTVEYKQVSLARYTTPYGSTGTVSEFERVLGDVVSTAHSLEAYLVKGNLWARIRFTGRSIKPEGERLFYSIVDSARFVDVSNPATSFDYYSIGRTFSAKKDYGRAAECFSAAVELEKNQPQLDSEHWEELIKNYAAAKVAMSDLAGAIEILDYGTRREPTRAGLFMELARRYASLADSENTLATLKKAFVLLNREQEIFEKTKYPIRTWPTLILPDVTRDPAFKEMMKDKTFRKAVKAMKRR